MRLSTLLFPLARQVQVQGENQGWPSSNWLGVTERVTGRDLAAALATAPNL